MINCCPRNGVESFKKIYQIYFSKYQPDHLAEDYLIESILYRSFIDGRLVGQESKLGHKYSDLQKIWRQKVKEIRAKQAEEQKQVEANK